MHLHLVALRHEGCTWEGCPAVVSRPWEGCPAVVSRPGQERQSMAEAVGAVP